MGRREEYEWLREIRVKAIAEGYFDKKFPARSKVNGRWTYCWQSAYADAFDCPNMLPGDIYDMLSSFNYKDGLSKYYYSADIAIADLYRAIEFYEEP